MHSRSWTAFLDGWTPRYKVRKRYVLDYLLDISDFTLSQEPHVLVRQLDTRERHPDYCEITTFSQRWRGSTRRRCEIGRRRSFHVLREYAPILGHAPSSCRETSAY